MRKRNVLSTKEKKGKFENNANKENNEKIENNLNKKKELSKEKNETVNNINRKLQKPTKKISPSETPKKNEIKTEGKNINKMKIETRNDITIKNDNIDIKRNITSKNIISKQLPITSKEVKTKDLLITSKTSTPLIRGVNIQFEKDVDNVLEIDLVKEVVQILFVNSISVVVKKDYFLSLLRKHLSPNELLGIMTALDEYKYEDLLLFKNTKNVKKKYTLVTSIDTFNYFMKKNKSALSLFDEREKKKEPANGADSKERKKEKHKDKDKEEREGEGGGEEKETEKEEKEKEKEEEEIEIEKRKKEDDKDKEIEGKEKEKEIIKGETEKKKRVEDENKEKEKIKEQKVQTYDDNVLLINTQTGINDEKQFNYVFIQPKKYISSNEKEIEKEISLTNITENRKKIKNYIYINKDKESHHKDLDMLDQTHFVSFKNRISKETKQDRTIDFFSTNSVTHKETDTQTHRPVYKSVGTQYNIQFLNKKKEEISKSIILQTFLNKVLPTVEKALIENLIISQKEQQKKECFDDFTSTMKNNLKKLFIYTDVKYTTDKIILFILQMSTINHITFIVYINNNKVENYIEGVNTYSYILIWHYHNYINPVYAFISPYQITSAIIKEKGINYIIAGCSNGMLVIWKLPPDFFEIVDADSKINEKTIDVEPFLFSNIEQTHKREVTSLVLLNDKSLILCDKKISIDNQPNSYLLVSISVDSSILLWDVTNMEELVTPKVKTKKKSKIPADELYSFKPLLKINVKKPNTEYSLGFIYFHFLEVTQNIASFFGFSEEGEYVVGDLYGITRKEKKYSVVNIIDDEYKNFKTLLCVKRSPILKYLILSLTDTNFYLWKEDEIHPIFISPRSPEIYSCCEFSSTKVGVIFIGKLNGQIEIWNLMDQKNHYVSSITISSYSLTCISMFQKLSLDISYVINTEGNVVEDDVFKTNEDFRDTNEYLTSKNKEDIYKYTYNKVIIGDSSGCVFVYEIKNNFLNSSKEEIDEYVRWVQNRVLINKQKVKRQEELNIEKEKGLSEEKKAKERKEQLKIRLDEDYKNILEKYKSLLTGEKK